MGVLKRPGHYFIIEPFYWLFRCFFQPAHFQKDFAQIALRKRIAMMLRLFLPIFICTYPPALLIRIGLFAIWPHLYNHYFVAAPGIGEYAFPFPSFLFDATWSTIVS